MDDLIIIGAGPIGLCAGIYARRAGLKYRILEQGTICQSLVEYPIGMRFFSPADELAIGGYPFPTPHDEKPTREMALNYYRKVASAEELVVQTYERVERVKPVESRFRVHTVCLPHGKPRKVYETRTVLLTTGIWGRPRRLQVPGADLPHVWTRYDEPTRFWRKRVLIVGSGNSAGECAIRLSDADAKVWLAVETEGLEQARFRPFILREVQLRVEERKIVPLLKVTIREIESTCVHLSCVEGDISLPVDFVLTLVGLEPDTHLIQPLDVAIDEAGKPQHDPETYETSVPGIYVGGAISQDGFIYIARERIQKAIQAICARLQASE